jgi:hypothetical protein
VLRQQKGLERIVLGMPGPPKESGAAEVYRAGLLWANYEDA